MSPKMSPKRASEKVDRARPSRSAAGSVALTFASLVSVSTIAAIPIGTLTKKIHSQPNASVSAPPISGPTATAPPTVAPQMPIAVARSRPSNSWAISASEVANIAAAPDALEGAEEVQHGRVVGEAAAERGGREDREADA